MHQCWTKQGSEETGEHEAGEEAKGPGELDDVPGADVLGVVVEAVKVEQQAQAAAADKGIEGVGERLDASGVAAGSPPHVRTSRELAHVSAS